MGIESCRIAGEPFAQIRHLWQRPVESGFAAPGECENFIDDNGVVTQVCRNPEFEGQMYFQLIKGGNTYMASMFIAVDVSGVLTYTRVQLGEIFDRYTGLPLDPLAP